ncbi:MAG: hypothetical protein SPK00_01280 [Corynebacterium glucuronolyticum]|nr:GntP family permease [Corynebacterium glucuronolyticum]MDD7586726.1 hypothetical protein [Mycobacteriaceae bacterium]MDY5833375.1 hypothetical protein [Corynebacterium glucuronolyticum]
MSTLHCFVPPHPGPFIAIDTLSRRAPIASKLNVAAD